ncbi:MAG TPA: lysine exporter LysO family protein [Syntrophomonadaceae bacterium]|nr:lysine exporter LysO family protein [Syntrophomonadaceae bacterium]
MWLPFLCLAVGAIISKWIKPYADKMMHFSLLALLLGLGIRIGADQKLLASIPQLGIKALIVCVLSSTGSLVFMIIWEKLFLKNGLHNRENETGPPNFSKEYLFILNVVLFLIMGISTGHFLYISGRWTEWGITTALVVIYVSVGVGLKDGFIELRSSTHKFAYFIIPFLILLGSVGGGLLAALLLKMKPVVVESIAGGVGYYSLTAAMITQKAGVEAGFIAFLTNFFREVFTYFLTPFLVRISPLAPVALGGASTMDTTLAVMKRFLGKEYAVLAFISGTLLTIMVPILLLFLLSFS